MGMIALFHIFPMIPMACNASTSGVLQCATIAAAAGETGNIGG